jgi:hypothetical protein
MTGQRTVNALVDSVSLGQIIRECECPEHMDFACIDVDGQDFYLWRDTPGFKPRVLCIEYNPYGEPDSLPPLGGTGQAGRIPLRNLGEERGYVLVAETFCNLIFVHGEAPSA